MQPGDQPPIAALDIGSSKVSAIIARVDDEQVQGLTYQQFGTKLVGEVGSTVKLTVVRPSGDKPIDFSIVRDNTTRRSVRARGALASRRRS